MQKRLRASNIRNIALGTGFVFMIVANGLLATKIYTTSNQVILVPTVVKDGMVARGARDKGYLEALAKDAVYGIYNSSPEDAQYGRTVISRVASVANREILLRQYDEITKDIRERDISSYFETSRLTHNLAANEIVVEGILHTFLSGHKVDAVRRKILVSFVMEAGSARISKISNLEVE